MNFSAEKQNEHMARSLIQELVRLGVENFCIAPGSRSTPLTLAAKDNALAKVIMHYDERSLGFFALGIAKATRKPACVIVTSGTAIANLYPAVLEAYYDRNPLIILTADRPPELHDIGANQTIDQTRFFGSHCKWQFTIPTFDQVACKEALTAIISNAYYQSMYSPKGPVILNCQIREPFFPKSKQHNIHTLEEPYPRIISHFSKKVLSNESLQQIANGISNFEKGLIVVGKLEDDEEIESILEVAMRLQWPILADPLSHIRAIGADSASIAYYNHILQSTSSSSKLIPHAILYFGGALTSKPLSKWLKSVKPKKFLHVGNFSNRHDPELLTTERVEMNPALFSSLLFSFLPKRLPTLWFSLWKEASLCVEEALTEFVEENTSLSEPFTVQALKHPKYTDCHFFFSNSLPIRYADTFFFPQSSTGKILGNRGVSGIDGILSTALGITYGLNERVFAVVGDLSFLHDVTALSLVKTLNLPITYIVINNFGGGIFHFLPIAEKTAALEECFATGHKQEIQAIAKAYQIPVQQVDAQKSYLQALDQSLNREGPMIIEVLSDRTTNRRFHQEIEEYMQKKLLKNYKEKDLCFFTPKKEMKIVTL